MKNIFKKVYYILPFKKYIYIFLRLFWTPSRKVAGYLKFKGIFKLKIEDNKSLKIKNDHSTLPSLFFWHGLKKYEPITVSTWIKLCEKSNIIFDVGANFGIFGLIGKKVNPVSIIHFFEPLSRNTDRIKYNCEINQFPSKDIFIETSAVSNTSNEVIFYDMDSSENTIGSMEKSHVELHQHHTTIIPKKIKGISLDDYIFNHKINKIDLVKIDVEGSELKVLEGFKKGISQHEPTLFIEILKKDSFIEIHNLLISLSNNYFAYYIDENFGLKKNGATYSSNGNYIFTTQEIE